MLTSGYSLTLRRLVKIDPQMSLLLTFRQLWDLSPIACGASVISGGRTHWQYNKHAGPSL